MARIYGKLVRLDFPRLTPKDIEDLVYPVLDTRQRQELMDKWELDFSYSIAGVSRFRGNIMRQRGTLAVALRVIPYEIPTIESLKPEFDTTEVFRAKFLKSDPLLSRVSGFGTEEKSKKA